jgi:pterin-4a-carbinolamine dehydratase
MPNEILTKAEIDTALKQLDGWVSASMQANLRLRKHIYFQDLMQPLGS